MGKARRVRADRFRQQLAEHVIGEDSLVELEVADGDIIKVKLPVLLNEGDEYVRLMNEAVGEREKALVVLSFNPDRDAEEQLDALLAAGYDYRFLAAFIASESAVAQEALGKFRYRA